MKKCPFCAEEIKDEAIKCKHCGEMLVERVLCGHCGSKNPKANEFCDECGWQLSLQAKKGNAQESRVKERSEKNKELTSKTAITGFVFGLISVFVGGEFSLFPILAIIFSSFGIFYTKSEFNKKGKWIAIVGLTLGILFLVVNLYNKGYIK